MDVMGKTVEKTVKRTGEKKPERRSILWWAARICIVISIILISAGLLAPLIIEYMIGGNGLIESQQLSCDFDLNYLAHPCRDTMQVGDGAGGLMMGLCSLCPQARTTLISAGAVLLFIGLALEYWRRKNG